MDSRLFLDWLQHRLKPELLKLGMPICERYTPIPKTPEVILKAKGATKVKPITKPRRASRRATKLCWPTKAKRTTKAKTARRSKPHPFSRLPAEIRAKIWAIALHDQTSTVPTNPSYRLYLHLSDTANVVAIHQVGSSIRVKTNRGYPTLFFVNREARYEAAKLDGGEWYPLGVGAVEVYANFNKERIYVLDSYKGPRSSVLLQKALPFDQQQARVLGLGDYEDKQDWLEELRSMIARHRL